MSILTQSTNSEYECEWECVCESECVVCNFYGHAPGNSRTRLRVNNWFAQGLFRAGRRAQCKLEIGTIGDSSFSLRNVCEASSEREKKVLHTNRQSGSQAAWSPWNSKGCTQMKLISTSSLKTVARICAWCRVALERRAREEIEMRTASRTSRALCPQRN